MGVSAGSVVVGTHLMVGELTPIISEVRGEFFLFNEASEHIFEWWEPHLHLLVGGGGGGGGVLISMGLGALTTDILTILCHVLI